MCGICGLVSLDGATAPDPGGARRDERDAGPPRPRLRGLPDRRPLRPGDAAALDHRPGRRRSADRQRGRPDPGDPERRDLQLPRADGRAARRAATPSRPTATPRCWSTSTRSDGPTFVERAARDVRARALGLPRRPPGAGPRPLRHQAALLPRRAAASSPSPRSSRRCCASRASRGRSTPTRSRPSSPSTRSRRRSPSSARRASCRRATRWSAERGEVDDPPLRAARRRSRRSDVRTERDEALAEELREPAAGLGPRPPRLRRAGRRAALRRHRLRRADGAGRGRERLSGEHLLDRLRGAAPSTSSSRPAWSPSATAPTTTSWSSARTRSSCCRGWSRPSTSPSATPRRCPTYLVSQLAADTVKVVLSGRGRRRALRRLLHLRRRPARARVWAGRRRCSGRWSSCCRAPRAR